MSILTIPLDDFAPLGGLERPCAKDFMLRAMGVAQPDDQEDSDEQVAEQDNPEDNDGAKDGTASTTEDSKREKHGNGKSLFAKY